MVTLSKFLVNNFLDYTAIKEELDKSRNAFILISALFIPFLYFFRFTLPFPFPHFFIIVIVFLLLNLFISIIIRKKEWCPFIYRFLPYVDSLFSPFIFFCTGGFISPFIVTHMLTIMGSASTYVGYRFISINIYLIVTLSYIGVSLSQKYGILPNYVAYSQILMQNDVFFSLIFFTTVGVLSLGLVVGKVLTINIHQLLARVSEAYSTIVEGTSSRVGRDLFKPLVKHLAEAMKFNSACIGRLDEKNSFFIPLAVYCNNAFHESASFQVKGSPIERVITEGIYICPKDTGRQFPDDAFIKNFKAESFVGVALTGIDGAKLGAICVMHDRTLLDEYAVYSVVNVFASRAAAEIEREIAENKRILMKEQLAHGEKMQAIGQLASGIAHDFNNLITSIVAHAQAMTYKTASDPQQQHHVEKIIAIGQKAGKIVSQLLMYGHRTQMRQVTVDLHKSISDIIDILKHTINKKIKLKWDLRAAQYLIIGDPSLLQSALLNLSLNARDAMPNGGELTFTTDIVDIGADELRDSASNMAVPAGRYVSIAVADTGMGMSKEIMSHIFEPFFTTKDSEQGTGLGLSSVYSCVDSHNGHITVESTEGKGTSFRLYFPFTKEHLSGTSDENDAY